MGNKRSEPVVIDVVLVDLRAIQAELASIRERLHDREKSAEEKIASLEKQLADVKKQKTDAEMTSNDWRDYNTKLENQLRQVREKLWEMLREQRKIAPIEVQRPSSTPFEPTAHPLTFVFYAGKGSVTVKFTLLPDGNIEKEREIELRRHGNLIFFFNAYRFSHGHWPRVKAMELLDVIFSRAVFFLHLEHSVPADNFVITGPKKCLICDDNAEYLFCGDKETYCCPRHTTLKFAGRNIHGDVSSGNTVVMMC